MENLFNAQLKTIMKSKKITQRGLAAQLGVSQQAVCGWCNKDIPTLERFIELCQALQITPNELLGVTERTDYQDSQV